MANLLLKTEVYYKVEMFDEDYQRYLDGTFNEEDLVDIYLPYCDNDHECSFEVVDATVQ